jgi:hypothetical protein
MLEVNGMHEERKELKMPPKEPEKQSAKASRNVPKP